MEAILGTIILISIAIMLKNVEINIIQKNVLAAIIILVLPK